MTQASPQIRRHNTSGFVLPYVLFVIVILSIAGIIAAQRLSSVTAVVDELQNKIRSEKILQSAEAAATYSLLTGNPGSQGYDLSPQSPIAWEFGTLSADGLTPLGDNDKENIPEDMWLATGSARSYALLSAVSQTNNFASSLRPVDAVISLQDAAGLVSLNQQSSRLLINALQYAGASETEADKLAQLLWDYIDFDSSKRPEGAESQDYRRLKKTQPSNSPIRTFEELGALVYWDEMLNEIDLLKLKEFTTVVPTPGFRKSFATETQSILLDLDSESFIESRRLSFENQLEINNSKTSGTARIRIWARRHDGQFDKRVIDIERKLKSAGAPYRRHWVYDSTVLRSDLEKSVTRSDSGDGTLKLDGLKHVVHTAASAP